MPALKGDILPTGLLLDTQVGWSGSAKQSLRAALRPIPPPLDARAILDSGAEVTALDASLVQALGLVPSSFTLANFPAAGGMTIGREYEVGLTIIHPAGNPGLNLVISDLPLSNCP
jgi:hypothetical protein